MSTQVDMIEHQARSKEGRGLSVRGGDSDKWITIQKNTFMNWVNIQLQPLGMAVTDFQEDFDDGIRLCALMEQLQKKKIGKVIKKPINQHQKLENVTLALNAIANDNIRLVNIGSEDIVNGSLKLILGLIWHLILRYQIGKTKFPPKKLMLAWLQAVVPEMKINNFTSDWNDGIALHALIDYCRPGLYPNWSNLSRSDRLDNCRQGMELASREFNIPQVVRPEDLASPHLDELSGMTYLSYYMNVDSPGYHATMNNVRRLLKQGSFNNFTSDWNDGRLLCNLVTSVGGNVVGYPELTPNNIENLQRGVDSARRLGVEPILSAKEMADPEVEHLGIMAYAAYFTHLQPQKSMRDKAFLDGNFQNVHVGQEKHFRVTVDDDMSPSDVRGEVIGPDSIPPVRMNWNGRTADCYFTPSETGQHRLNIYCGGEPISGCPVPFKVSSDRSKVYFQPVDKCTVGSVTDLKVDASAAGQGDIRMEVRTPGGRVQNLPVMYRQGKYTSDFTPTEVGDHHVSVSYDGEEIHGSPFVLHAFDPSLVRVYGLAGGAVGKAVMFNADCTKAGNGNLRAQVTHNGSNIPCYISQESYDNYKVDFTPQGAGTYKVNVFYDDVEVRGSPYTLDIVDSSMVTVSGDGLSLVPVKRPANFSINTNGAGGGNVKVEITSPDGQQLPTRLVPEADGDYRVEWTPAMAGRHTVDVLFAGQQVQGSPFHIDVFDVNKIHVDNFFHNNVGEQAGFHVDATRAGSAEKQVRVVSPSGRTVSCDIEERGSGDYYITYVPNEVGKHNIHLSYGGLELPGSPFSQEIGEGVLPTAHGDGLYRGEEDKAAVFHIDARGLPPGEPKVQVDGPNSIAKCSIDPQPNGMYTVTYVPVEVGMFDVTVRWNNKELHGSPFHPKIVDARKVRVVGGWQHYMDPQERVTLVVGEEKSIPFDTSEAGPGKLTAEVRGPSGKVPCRIDDNSVGKSVILFTPREEGSHYIHLFWSEHPLENSPFLGYATSGSPDPTKVILTGRGLKEATVREEAEFMIDGSQAGPGEPEVQLLGVRAEVNVIVTPLGGGKFRCTYIPIIPGAYLLHITWNGRQLRGSPYKVNVTGAFFPNKVIVTGEGLKSGILGQDLGVRIDTRKAGPGELTAHCMGPSRVAHCELDDNHDGTFHLKIRPLEAGRHVLQIRYGGEHVLGSPFYIKVSALPDASKVRVSGPGVEHGILATYQSRFIVETRGAGAGQLTVRIRGPKGAFQVEMYRDSQKDRTILCRYDPTETGLYLVHVKWSGEEVPGSPFKIHIVDTQAELEQVLQDTAYGSSSLHSQSGYSQWREEL